MLGFYVLNATNNVSLRMLAYRYAISIKLGGNHVDAIMLHQAFCMLEADDSTHSSPHHTSVDCDCHLVV
jgi:hypothetical protein